MWYSTSSGRIELNITKQQAQIGHHTGQCDDDVMLLSRMPSIVRQLNKLEPSLVREELKEFGAWDEIELADDAQNLQRLLWVACGDIVENLT